MQRTDILELMSTLKLAQQEKATLSLQGAAQSRLLSQKWRCPLPIPRRPTDRI
jgi:hypothetical protein